ncbi:MAG: bifunctional riboflavin kinase/FAD synthetase [Halanaerobiales bacterium]
MEVIKSKHFNNLSIGPIVIAMGTFDGLHLGHQTVIKTAIKIARENNTAVGVYTFDPHPLKIVKPALAPDSILSTRQKIKFISQLDLNFYLQQKFTAEFASLDYEDFIKKYLVDRINISHIVVGEDFKFGRQEKGNITSFKKYGKKYGFGFTAVKSVTKNGQRISSTAIRKMIGNGKIKKIPDYLGRNYRLNGTVIHGDKRGRKIGVPTANLKLETNYKLPPCGVYACWADNNGSRYRGLVNFGYNPTFANNKYSVEVHILNFDKEDIYNEKISIELIDFIREEMTFNSSEELVKQIKKDILYTKSVLCYN